MHLYQGASEQFIADAVQARLANQLSDRFFQEFRYQPSPGEVMSWRNSLGATNFTDHGSRGTRGADVTATAAAYTRAEVDRGPQERPKLVRRRVCWYTAGGDSWHQCMAILPMWPSLASKGSTRSTDLE
jgi:hypothetical protein